MLSVVKQFNFDVHDIQHRQNKNREQKHLDNLLIYILWVVYHGHPVFFIKICE